MHISFLVRGQKKDEAEHEKMLGASEMLTIASNNQMEMKNYIVHTPCNCCVEMCESCGGFLPLKAGVK